ncbi:MAG TPA: diguanylate cyclase [Thermoanaerobaculia bacterium]|nr:diguanylate cyclase [Thermoanaerobaculia bacterium]
MPAQRRRRTDGEPDLPAYRALVADDDENYLAWIAHVARRFGFSVTACRDGGETVEVIDRGEAFDIAIIDCEMPRGNGFQVIEALRQSPANRDSYAVMLTGREEIETKVRALENGFDDFLGKSATDLEIAAKLTAARRIVARQRRLDEAVRDLYGLATRDELTGLLNRRFFFAEASRILAEGRQVGLILFDLDEFKPVNDTFGHLAGDRILRDIGSLFIRRTRGDDLVARYGGDEFVMLVHNADPAAVELLAERIAGEIGALQWTFGTETIHIRITAGVASSALLDNPTLARLLSTGDRDLYKNKWLAKTPESDPSLYAYDSRRDDEIAAVLDFTLPIVDPKKMRRPAGPDSR